MSWLGGNEGSGGYSRGERRSLSPNSMIQELEELQSQLAAQHDALVHRQNQARDHAAQASEFDSRMRTLERRLRDMLSDSAEAAKHKRRGKSGRMPGPIPGVDPDTSEQRRLQIFQQREHLEAEIRQLRYSSSQFSRQAREHADEARAIRRSMEQIQERIKRLKKEIEKAERQERRDNKRGGGGPRGGGGRGGGPSQPQRPSDQYYDGGWSGGDYNNYLDNGGNGQHSTSYSSTQNRAAAKATGHHANPRALKTDKTNHTKR